MVTKIPRFAFEKFPGRLLQADAEAARCGDLAAVPAMPAAARPKGDGLLLFFVVYKHGGLWWS